MKYLNSLKIWFYLFLCIYFFLYIFPFPFSEIPWQIGEGINTSIENFWKWLVPLLASEILGYKEVISIEFTGSGDTTFDYFLLLAQVSVALLLSLALFFVQQRVKSLKPYWPYFHVLLRYYLAAVLLSYGFAKVIPNQFIPPSLSQLIQPFGDSSPMGLLWNFMGYSAPYTIFSGIMEVVAGMLLFFRRTTKLGAFVAMAVLLNIFLLNLFYDVPVKLYSLHLLVLSFIILYPFYKVFWQFFVLNRPTIPVKPINYYKNSKFKWPGYAFKGVFIALVASTSLLNNLNSAKEYGRKAKLPPLYGIYEVEDFIVNRDTLLPVLTDSIRWRRLIIDRYYTAVYKMNNDILYAETDIDTVTRTLKIKPYRETVLYTTQYELREGSMRLVGNRGKDTLQINCKIRNPEDFYLLKRGFHWINEYPNNR